MEDTEDNFNSILMTIDALFVRNKYSHKIHMDIIWVGHKGLSRFDKKLK